VITKRTTLFLILETFINLNICINNVKKTKKQKRVVKKKRFSQKTDEDDEPQIKPDSKSIIEIKDIYKSFGNNLVLNNINLSIPANKISGIIGMSGGGKTTLLNLIIGFLDIDDGKILIHKDAIKDNKSKENYLNLKNITKKVKQNFGFASQNASVYPELTIEENLKYFGRLQKLNRKQIKEHSEILLKFTKLEDYKKLLAKELSGGMLKRLDIACSIIHQPKVLILDEPTSNLDPISRSHVWDLIKKINSQGTTIIISSHFIEELELLCDKVAVIHNGKIASQGSPMHLKENYAKADVISFDTISGDYKNILTHLKKIDRNITYKIELGKIYVYSKKSAKLLKELIKILNKGQDHLLSLELNKPSLKEVFESLEANN